LRWIGLPKVKINPYLTGRSELHDWKTLLILLLPDAEVVQAWSESTGWNFPDHKRGIGRKGSLVHHSSHVIEKRVVEHSGAF
jgi:hypothetical protein